MFGHKHALWIQVIQSYKKKNISQIKAIFIQTPSHCEGVLKYVKKDQNEIEKLSYWILIMLKQI